MGAGRKPPLRGVAYSHQALDKPVGGRLRALDSARLRSQLVAVFTKFVIRNVGVLRAFDTPGSPRLAKLTLFYDRNGRGKSTLTSVLRAARDGCASTVLGRRSLGNSGAAPEVTLVSPSGNIRFANGKWATAGAAIEVFDTTFIADNIYAGELIDLAHDRGLFSIIVGNDGVRLAKHLERFNAAAKTAAARLKEAQAALSSDVPTDGTMDEFFALAQSPDHQKRLDAAERALKAVQQADKIAALSPLVPLVSPELPGATAAVLASTIADVDGSARQRLVEHFKRFAFDKQGEAWVTYGVEHIHDDACPFCGREDVDALGTVALYSKIFSETYKGHLSTITATAAQVEEALGEDARAALVGQIAANAEAVRKWAEYVRVDQELPEMAELGSRLIEAHRGAKSLFDRKRSSPLEPAGDEPALAAVTASIASAKALIDGYNVVVAAINEATEKVTGAVPTTLQAATLARDNAQRRLRRHDAGVQSRINALLIARRRERRARDTRTLVQARLKKANEDAATHYHQRVNHYLARFGASFEITAITNNMQGNAGQADYGLRIKGETVMRGRGRQAPALPTFRNTLSAGDKTTLAFAFFLAKLDQDGDLCRKTLVIDDPLSSHDSHRRRMTVEAIKELSSRCLQVVVLSHDEFLLRDVQRRCGTAESAAFEIDFTGGDEWSSASAVTLDALCRSAHTKMVDELTAFVNERKGDPDDVVLKVRQVLETHYRRSYTAYFPHDRNLGQIVRDIAEGGSSHPCLDDLARLDNCNDATCDRHHGDDAMVVVKCGVDPDELRTIVRDALELIGAMRPAAAPGPAAATG